MKPSPHCTVCQHGKVVEINRLLLKATPATKIAKEAGLNVAAVRVHQKKHLPYRGPGFPKAVTVEEQVEELKFELSRLQALGECGEAVGPAIQAINAKRGVLEFEARLQGRLQGSHKSILAAPSSGDEFEVVFEGGRPRTVAVSEEASEE